MKRTFIILTTGVLAVCSLSRTPDPHLFAQEKHPISTPLVQNGVDTPVIIAHRGASGYLPEHTTESAVLAHALGADLIEQDVVLTRDGEPVVLHDVTLDHVTDVGSQFPDRVASDGHFYAADFTLEELRKLRVTERREFRRRDDSTRFPAGQGSFHIATLGEHLALIEGLNQSRTHKAGIYVEIKKPAWHRERGLDPSPRVLDAVRQFEAESRSRRIFIQCFEFDELRRLREQLDCDLPLIMLVSKLPTVEQLNTWAPVVDGIGASIPCLITGLDEQGGALATPLVSQCHERSLVVHAWTVRDDDLPTWCDTTDGLLDLLVRQCGVDGVFCDQPDTAVAWRSRVTQEGRTTGPFRLLNERPSRTGEDR